MSDNGSGVYNVNSTGQPVITATPIMASVFNAYTADAATALSNRICKDGQTTVIANIPMGGYKFTGVGAGSARTDSANIGNVQDGTGVYVATVAGTADAITLTPSPAITAYAAGQRFSFLASGANTTAATVNVSALGAKAITKNGTTALAASDIPSGMMVEITYDGTRFILGTTSSAVLNSPTLATATLNSPTLNSPTLAGTPVFPDNVFTIGGSADATKTVAFEVDGLTTATKRILTVQDADQVLVGRDTTDTLTNKTITSAVLNTGVSGTAIAAQADQETGTSATLLVTTGKQKFHPSAAKAWVQFSANAGSIVVNASYNVTSVVRNAAGNYTVTFTTAFSSIYYGYSLGGTANTGATGGGQIYGPVSSAPTTTTFIIGTTTTGTTPADWDYVSAIFMGDQ